MEGQNQLQIPQGNRRRMTKMQKASQLFSIANLHFNTGLEAASYILRCPPEQRLPQENFFISAHILKFDYFQNLQRKYGQTKFDYICHSMQARIYQKGDTIFTQGDQAEEFYVVLVGSVSVVVKPKYNELDDLEAPLVAREVNVLGPGEVFGELALIKGKHGTRAATIFCKETCDIAFFTNTIFNKLLLDKEKDRFDENLNLLYSIEVFKDCPEQIIRNTFMYSRIKQFLNNQLVYNQGDVSDFFIIIKSGQFQKQHTLFIEEKKYQVKICTMSQGEIFGYDELVDDLPRKYQVKCVSSFGELFMVAKHDFKSRIFYNSTFKQTLLNLMKQNLQFLKQRIEQTESFDNIMVNKLFASNYKKHKHQRILKSIDTNPSTQFSYMNNNADIFVDHNLSNIKSMRNLQNKIMVTDQMDKVVDNHIKADDNQFTLPSISTYTSVAKLPSASTYIPKAQVLNSPSTFAENVFKFKHSLHKKQPSTTADQDSFEQKSQDIQFDLLGKLSVHKGKQRNELSTEIKINRQIVQPKEIKYYWRMMQKLERYQQVNEIQHQQNNVAPGKLSIYKSFFQFELDFAQKKLNQLRHKHDL